MRITVIASGKKYFSKFLRSKIIFFGKILLFLSTLARLLLYMSAEMKTLRKKTERKGYIMLITLAQALKEKNRIAGEISKLWLLVQRENSCWETHTRSIDVTETMQTINEYTQKLIELKTKIGKANAGNLENMYALEEYKSQISKYGNIDTDEEVRYLGENEDRTLSKTCIIKTSEVLKLQKSLQIKCNQLQDALDEYNATHKIEFDTPLK